jgi:hypothetical protein
VSAPRKANGAGPWKRPRAIRCAVPNTNHAVSATATSPVGFSPPSPPSRAHPKLELRSLLTLAGLLGAIPSDRQVLTALWTHEREGVCWPSHECLVRTTGLSLATVKRCRSHLRRIGCLTWDTPPPRLRALRHTCHYRVALPDRDARQLVLPLGPVMLPWTEQGSEIARPHHVALALALLVPADGEAPECSYYDEVPLEPRRARLEGSRAHPPTLPAPWAAVPERAPRRPRVPKSTAHQGPKSTAHGDPQNPKFKSSPLPPDGGHRPVALGEVVRGALGSIVRGPETVARPAAAACAAAERPTYGEGPRTPAAAPGRPVAPSAAVELPPGLARSIAAIQRALKGREGPGGQDPPE